MRLKENRKIAKYQELINVLKDNFFSKIILFFSVISWGFQFLFSQDTYPYLIEIQTSSQVVYRATSDSRGIPSTELILRPNSPYRLWMLDSQSLRVGRLSFVTPANGQTFTIPSVRFRNPLTPDSDGDGLHDEAEFILGTNAAIADTDMDGINDGAEFFQGLNPLDGLIAQTGIVANVDTNGEAIHVHAFNDLAILAERHQGVTVFNVFNAMAPIMIAKVDTPGEALASHHSGRFVAVADGDSGLAIIDIQDPPSARIIHQIPRPTLGGRAQSVITTAGIAFVGLANGKIAKVDLPSGTLLDQLLVMGNIQDITLSRDHLYALAPGLIHTIQISNGDFELVGTITSPGSQGAGQRPLRLFSESDLLYSVHNSGYNTFDLSDPGHPTLISHGSTAQQGWKKFVTNGSGIGVAAVSPNSTDDGPHHISIYDASDPSQTNEFQTTYETPGLAADVVIYNGLAYVADSNSGLQVINYLPFDTASSPPSMNLDVGWGSDGAEEGKLVRVSADVSDDLQVRNVEFYLDGVKAATDGNFPFEFRFRTPKREGQSSFSLQARASDTGGNSIWTDLGNIALTPDVTPPRVKGVSPSSGSALGAIATLAAFFTEPIDEETLTSNNFYLFEAGSDGEFDTGDDFQISAIIEWREDLLGAFFILGTGLLPGHYRASVTTGVKDLAGNQLFQSTAWAIRVYDVGADRDGDGVPDDLEPVLGLDPDNLDTNANGIFDGDEDFDNDGSSNLQEVLIGTDPDNPDSDGDGFLDGQEDNDGDGLSDVAEILTHGTDPTNRDTDGDGFNDSDEITDGSSPLDPQSLPPSLFSNAAVGLTIGIFNRSNPSNRFGLFSGLTVSLKNLSDPSWQLGEINGATVSVENSAAPETSLGKTRGVDVSIDNQAQPAIKGVSHDR